MLMPLSMKMMECLDITEVVKLSGGAATHKTEPTDEFLVVKPVEVPSDNALAAGRKLEGQGSRNNLVVFYPAHDGQR